MPQADFSCAPAHPSSGLRDEFGDLGRPDYCGLYVSRSVHIECLGDHANLAGPLAAGRWTGFQNAIGNLGGVVSPLLTGWVVSETGSFSLAFAAATVVLIGGTTFT